MTPEASGTGNPELAAPLVIQEQGRFAVGGAAITAPGTFDPRDPTKPHGQTLHGDHARVFYQIPADARRLPLVLWHGWWGRRCVLGNDAGRSRGFPNDLP